MNLSKRVKITLVQAPLAAGVVDATSDSVDMAGFDGVLFVGVCGTIVEGGVANLTAQQSSDDSTFAALSGMVEIACSANKLVLLDVYRPTERYVRSHMSRGVENVTWGGTLAIQYRGAKGPTAHDAATLAAEVLGISPDEV